MLIMPHNADQAIKAICAALLSGRIPMKRLEQALQRRRKALEKIDSFNFECVQKENKIESFEIESVDDRNLAEKLLVNSIEIHNKFLIRNKHLGINLLRVDGVIPCPYLTPLSPAFCLPQTVGYRPVLFPQYGVSPWQDNCCENALVGN